MARQVLRGTARPKDAKKTFFRLMAYFKKHLGQFAIVILMIVVQALTSLLAVRCLGNLIDTDIPNLIDAVSGNPLVDSDSAFRAFNLEILWMGIIYLLSVVSTYVYNLLMATISRSILAEIRGDIFVHMEKLPIRFFDSHTHGELMSYYTNDVDAIRQMLSQAIPQIISSVITVVSTFIYMLIASLELTLVCIAMVSIVLFASSRIAKRS